MKSLGNNIYRTFRDLGNIPISNSILASISTDIQTANRKVTQWEHEGVLIRLRRGLYIVAPEISQKPISTELLANHICAPSYVSMLSALRFYGLIPEMVYSTQSMCLKSSRTFENRLGRFEYHHISKDCFPIGLRYEIRDGFSFVIATPEKALCDLVAQTPGLNLRYKKETAAYLEEDLRLDMEALRDMDMEIFRQYATIGKKAESINAIINLLKR